MRALVTGGAGFIGSAVVELLASQGHYVSVYDNLETGSRDHLPAGVELIVADVRDAQALNAACQGSEVIIHLAALVSVAISVAEPQLCWDVNVTGTHRVLEAARLAGCRRVVLASSAAVYGNDPTLPKHEELPPAPASPYAHSKWLNELEARYYSEYHGLETVCLRFFNVFGPRQHPGSPYSGAISIAARQLLADEPFTVFGTGEQTRDFVYVQDVAAALVGAALQQGLHHEVLNVGRGERTSLLEMLSALGDVLGRTPKLHFAEPRPGDVLHSLASVRRAAEKLGYRAGTPLREGLAQTLAWMEGNRIVAT